ncbi:tryptophan-rich sensory protein [Rhizobium skierniewicense]|uniref:Tryptophan-rich sensory protein n=1 Tax=Rhizobium skierniewicense TaxID=984260 RepID=A0A7W6G3M2_9HYPH|nr:tryptophan-rich sensory protein [Rhizobium skierniewicense]
MNASSVTWSPIFVGRQDLAMALIEDDAFIL